MLGLIFTIFILICMGVLGLIVFLKNPRNRINKLFALMVFWIMAFVTSNFLENEPTRLAGVFLRIDFASAALMVYFWFLFCLNFPEAKKPLSILKHLMILLPALIFAGFAFSNFLIQNINLGEQGIKFDFGILYIPYVVYIIGYMILGGCGSLIRKYRRAKGIQKSQILYVLLGLSLSGTIGIVVNLFLQNVLPVELFRIGIYGVIFIVAFTAYAMVKYRLMDIRLVIKQGTVYLASLAVVVGLAVIGVWGIAHAADKSVSSWLLVGGALGLALGLLIFDPIKRGFQKIANKYLFVSLYNYQEAVRALSQKLTTSIDLNKIIDSIMKIAMETMKLDKAGVLVRDLKTGKYRIQKIIGFQKENGISLVQDNFLTNYLQTIKKPLVYEELDLQIRDTVDDRLRTQLKDLRANMKRIEAAVCLPLLREDRIQGIIVLGHKISGDAYSEQDIELLETLTNQASVAIENGRLYREVQDLTQHLQEKVDEQTRHLKKLFEVKTEFLHLVSHQLRTPLTALRGLLSMWAEGTFDSYTEEEKQKIKQRIQISCERLNNITNDMLDTLDIEEGYARFKFEPLDIEKAINEVIDLLRPNFDKKGLYIKIVKPDQPLSKIQADKQYLPQALQNIIDNAEKYTSQGGLTITFSQPTPDQVQISFKDTGLGISPEDQKHLFQEKFFRGQEADKIHTSGTGLGLYIVKHIIEGHQGTIEVHSQGENQGSEFVVSLPVIQE